MPISIQAFTGQTLKEQNVATFDDDMRLLPNVAAASNGPGQNEIFMCGLSTSVRASQGSGTSGLLPSVAIYLHEQSG